MAAAVTELTVDREFAALCTALSPEEANLLETSLEAEGCRDCIIVWANHEDTILDGHNRYRICLQLGIPFKTKAIQLETREDAINWIIANQLGRRNLTEEQRDYLRGKRYRAEKHQGERTDLTSGQNAQKSTAEKLADEYKVDEKTIRRDAHFADAIDTIAANVGPEAKQAILSGALNLTKQDVAKLAELPKREQKSAIAGGTEAIKEAVKDLGPTPHQEANDDPGRRWNATLHKLYVFMTSTRDLGGLKKLARKWTVDSKDEYAKELKRIVGELNKWIAILETER